jgi:hypothetical protein
MLAVRGCEGDSPRRFWCRCKTRDAAAIFDYRVQKVAEIFGGPPAAK